jgi:hypothetical protein
MGRKEEVMKKRATVYMVAGTVALLVAVVAAGFGVLRLTSIGEASKPVEPLPDEIGCAPSPRRPVQIAAAKLLIEYNSTDDDIGVHGGFDDHGWSELCVYAPSGTQILAVKPQAQLLDLTMAGIFFESREPPGSELSVDELKAQFPEGQYAVRGVTFEEQGLAGAATFTHDVPAAVVVTAPVDGAVVPTTNFVVEWEDVTESVDGGPVVITGYEVIITKLDAEDPHGFSTPTYDVHVPPDLNSLSVPAQFLEPGTDYEFEVLAIEESGNQTITSGFFSTQ